MTNRISKLIVLALLIVFVSLGVPIVAAGTSSLGIQAALAGDDDDHGHDVDITFTKWITTIPNMEGVVGGDVGTGTFVGEILDFVPRTRITNIEALYHINGSAHSFTAHVFVRQNEVRGTAQIRGVVTEGWLAGKRVRGSYTVISCPDRTNGVCFEGTLHIHVDTD